jgi:Imidazoleglycerol-phosphate dehydratase
MREAELERVTRETSIRMRLTLAGAGGGGFTGSSGIGFFDHMLNSFAVHGGFKLDAEIEGDLYVDAHHSVEDAGIVLGKLFAQVLGDKSGIARFGSAFVPMDESLAFAAVDVSGRPFLVFNARFSAPQIGSYDTQLTVEFFRALATNMGATLHLRLEYGGNAHHETEALFKAAARALASAVAETGGGILSAKGTL